MDKLGERVRNRREHKTLHLNELAEKVGVTNSCLSQIENGKSFPSIITLKKIADSLNTTIGDLVGEKDKLEFNPLIQFKNRKFVKTNGNGASLFLLSHHDPNKQMETYFVEFTAHADSSGLIDNHHGQAFCYIIEGRLEINLKDQEYSLKKGDSFYYNTLEKHVIKNDADTGSKMIWIITHPTI